MTNPLLQIREHGQRIWLDNLSRTLLREGAIEHFLRDDGIAGITSNPAIFFKAIAESPYYREELAELRTTISTPEARYEVLAVKDIQTACDLLRPQFDQTAGRDGYVSLEVSPALAQDANGTVAAGIRLSRAVNRPNLLIKVPATAAGIVAIEQLIGQGINVNVTLMFSLRHVSAVAAAYQRGVDTLRSKRGSAAAAYSVASVFLSRIDTLVDQRLADIGTPQALALRGKAAVALARLAYQSYQQRSPIAGARPQYLLWASTGTKNPAYSDVLYVESVIGADTINTVPDATLAAFRDHGRAAPTLTQDVAAAAAIVAELAQIGIDLDEIGETLQQEGLKLFEDAFTKLLQLMV